MGNKAKPWYHRGPHQQTSYHLRAAWTQDPNTLCARCGRTLEEGYRLWGIRARWEAGHVVAGDPSSGYQPEHAHCNRSHGATHGNRNRTHRTRPSTW